MHINKFISILTEPDKDKEQQFFVYWIGTGYFHGLRAQSFNTNLSEYTKRCKEDGRTFLIRKNDESIVEEDGTITDKYGKMVAKLTAYMESVS